MKVIICGGRDFGTPRNSYASKEEESHDLEIRVIPQRELFLHSLTELQKKYPNLEIISGMAAGADTLAVEFAKQKGLKLHEFPADWNRYHKGAGSVRNQLMIDKGKPNLIVAFPTKSSKGTLDMISRGLIENIEVIIIES